MTMFRDRVKAHMDGVRAKVTIPKMVVAVLSVLLLSGGVLFVLLGRGGGVCNPPPEGESLEECELIEAHYRFAHIVHDNPLNRDYPPSGLRLRYFNSHGIEYRFFLDWMLYRHETGADLDAFDEFFLIQDAARRRGGFNWREGPAPYDPEQDPEVAAYVAWAVENFCSHHNPRCNPPIGRTRGRDFMWALADIYMEYRNSREFLPGEPRVNYPEFPERLCTPLVSWELLAPLSPEAIVALVRAYSDPEYVLDLRGLLYRGDYWAHLDEIYANSLLRAGIDQDSLPFFGDGHLTRYFDGGCDEQLLVRLRDAYLQERSYIDICGRQLEYLSIWLSGSQLQDGTLLELLHPACPPPPEELGRDS